MNKLKRYTLGRVTLAKTENSSLQGAGIVECDHGEFYRCADIDPLLESIGAGGVTGNIDALDAVIAQCEKVSNRLGIEDHEQAVLEGELTLANALRASAWELSLISTLAKNLKESIQKKTVEQHRAEFELWLSSVETRGATDFERYMEDGFYMDWDVQRAWISWKAARGITE